MGLCRGLEGLDGQGDVFGWFTELWPRLRNELLENEDLYRGACASGRRNEAVVTAPAAVWYEFNQSPGETVVVPRGWLHAVVNLEATVAVTQNVCGRYDLGEVWDEMCMHAPEAAAKLKPSLDSLPRTSQWGAAWHALRGSRV
jgi:hypothetical protein